jgi:hypothetical protein
MCYGHTIDLVHSLNLKQILATLPVVKVQLVPAHYSGELRAGDLGEWGEVETVDQ